MIRVNTFTLALKYIFLDLIGGVVRFPFWWYSKGLVNVGRWGLRTIRMYGRSLSVGVWIKNLLVPMFGMYDWQSRIISFFMRLFQIVARGFIVLVWSILIVCIMVIYCIAPPVTVLMALLHLSSLL